MPPLGCGSMPSMRPFRGGSPEIDLDRAYTARKLIDLVLASTSPSYQDALYPARGRKTYIWTQLFYEEDLEYAIHATRD